MKTNRWLNGAIPAVGIHISIGAVYAWSVFTNPVMDALNVSLSQVSWIFSIAIFFLGMSAAFLGTIVENMGPRKSGLLCGLFYRPYRQRFRRKPAIVAAALFILRLHWRHWFGDWLYYASENAGQLVL